MAHAHLNSSFTTCSGNNLIYRCEMCSLEADGAIRGLPSLKASPVAFDPQPLVPGQPCRKRVLKQVNQVSETASPTSFQRPRPIFSTRVAALASEKGPVERLSPMQPNRLQLARFIFPPRVILTLQQLLISSFCTYGAMPSLYPSLKLTWDQTRLTASVIHASLHMLCSFLSRTM